MWPAGATSTLASTTRSPLSFTTKHRPTPRPSGYRPHRPAPRRRPTRGSSLRLPIAPGQSLLPWLAAGLAVALVVSMPWLAPQIVDAFEGVLRVFGVGLALLVAAAVIDVRTAFRRSLSLDR